MNSTTSVAIAGGGIIGLSTAWRLSQRGYHVSVYEAATLGGEASWAAAGMLAPGGEVEFATDISSLAIESRRLYSPFVRELEEATGVPIDYQECGALDIAYSDEELAALEERALQQAEIGIPSKTVPRESVRAFWPRVRTQDLAGARFYPQDGLVNPRDLVFALRSACQAGRVDVLEHCAVHRIRIEADRVVVEAHCGRYEHSTIVIAAGAWSDSIAIDGAPPIPSSEPVKGHMIGYQQPQQVCNSILRHGHTYIVQRASGFLIVGSSMERVGFNRDIVPEIARSLAERAGFVLPHLTETTPAEVWTGLRPASDRLHVGRWHTPRLYVSYGHFRNGILLAPITAQCLAAEISASLETR
ncbi:MAG: glycine oxidase ThiO [Acidobacteriaceae bacterium]|nr:glycine oxidase ThiO [Acidobacteriaceae bacterium]